MEDKKPLGARIGRALGVIMGASMGVCIISGFLALAIRIWTWIL